MERSSTILSRLTPRFRRVIARTRSLHRFSAFGAIRRLGSLPFVELKPRNFRSFVRQESCYALHHPLPRRSAANVDVTVVRRPHKTVAALLQLPVQLVEHDVAQQWGKDSLESLTRFITAKLKLSKPAEERGGTAMGKEDPRILAS